MKRIYLYPGIEIGTAGFINPYVSDLSNALSVHHEVVNKDSPTNKGIFDLLKYIRNIDLVYLNWIEDLPEKKAGFFQSIFFILFAGYLKLTGKKIIWTLHNKRSHSKRYKYIKSVLYWFLMKSSDLIVTHAKEGLEYIPTRKMKLFIHHPMTPLEDGFISSNDKVYDLIIWGSITKYKGIDTFIKYLNDSVLIDRYKILIVGKIFGSDLKQYLHAVDAEFSNITLIDSFIDKKELYGMMSKSRIILFCYHSDTILSSGALMDSLLAKSIILGPEAGAFNDLSEEGIVYTYKTYKDLIETTDGILKEPTKYGVSISDINGFIERNSWEEFSQKIFEAIVAFDARA